MPASLRNWAFTNITTIPEQMITDGDFPTVASANPEEPAAFKMALDKAREIDADLAMACDPDGDRIGMLLKTTGASGFYSTATRPTLFLPGISSSAGKH